MGEEPTTVCQRVYVHGHRKTSRGYRTRESMKVAVRRQQFDKRVWLCVVVWLRVCACAVDSAFLRLGIRLLTKVPHRPLAFELRPQIQPVSPTPPA